MMIDQCCQHTVVPMKHSSTNDDDDTEIEVLSNTAPSDDQSLQVDYSHCYRGPIPQTAAKLTILLTITNGSANHQRHPVL